MADVSSVRLEFEHMIPDVDPRGQTPGVCVGVHSKESGWTWDLTLRQPTLDTPWVFGGANGTAHLDLSLDAKKIDMVAVVGSGRFSPQYSVRRIRYVASPLAH
ncbi:hypothetical protein AKJ09_02900 [Labilithrix luteola]|uniref:Uncharacterized protein n=1 Tax=Labilithrix luteola TaxID=1391654 RepID=A0A0K1PSA4_9BACT|nr:hypothetical protein AKJ09_02900 [Labilithrix luteola]